MALSFKPPGVGQFTKRMAIYAVAVDDTADGGTTETPSVVTYAWCSIAPLSGRELFLAKAQQDTNVFRIGTVFQAIISPKMYGVYNGRRFNFTSVNDLGERHVELEIIATEVVAK